MIEFRTMQEGKMKVKYQGHKITAVAPVPSQKSWNWSREMCCLP